MNPKILLVCTCRWFTTARLAKALLSSGCDVEVIAPRNHPVTKLRAAISVHRFHALAPLRSIAASIARTQPDLIIPCDESAVGHVHRLYQRMLQLREPKDSADAVFEYSLGARSTFDVATSRTNLAVVAREQGIKVAATAEVRTVDDLTDWFARNECPAVVKADGTYGGRGVRIVHSVTEAEHAFRILSVPPSPAEALRRAVVNRDMNYLLPCLRRVRPVVNIQRFIAGQDANTTVASWKGKVVSAISALVVRKSEPNGPASVVQIVDNREMLAAAERIVDSLRLSGLFGFDFIIDGDTGHAFLIELNARATQMCHLSLGVGRDLPASLRAAVSGEPLREVSGVTEADLVALFPQEWLRDPSSAFLNTAYHDVPWSEPALIRASLDNDLRLKTVRRLGRGVRAMCGRSTFAGRGTPVRVGSLE
jgi:hypothetical protein